jgi:hypothetical protein
MKIKLTPFSEMAELVIPPPQKASNFLPEWFKDAPTHEEGYNGNKISRHHAGGTTATFRGCNPFLDTLTGGYMFQLAADVEFHFDGQEFVPRWLVDFPLVSGQGHYQSIGLPRPDERSYTSWKWVSGWKITTPKGYSTLFTHPFNRHDLPFRTFSGIVETDKFELQTDLPFQLLSDPGKDHILIKKGTPICQAIPFKRDSWSTEIAKYDDKERQKQVFNLYSLADKSYRSQYWERKNFN